MLLKLLLLQQGNRCAKLVWVDVGVCVCVSASWITQKNVYWVICIKSSVSTDDKRATKTLTYEGDADGYPDSWPDKPDRQSIAVVISINLG